uniref:Uncharacterized protein n=1 Tax=Arundo donax TaxID=35708 RepID=A0A0A8YKJ8_ARUDO
MSKPRSWTASIRDGLAPQAEAR